MPRKAIEAPPLKAVGPYSLGLEQDGLVFISGQIALDPATGRLVSGNIKAQTEQVFRNLKTVLGAAGLSLRNVLKTTVFLVNMEDFAAMNEIYQAHVTPPFPARSTIGVAALPLGAKIEIEGIAAVTPDDWPTRLT